MRHNLLALRNKKRLLSTPMLWASTALLLAVCCAPLASACAPEPSIDIEKTGPLFAIAGEEITYTFFVSNPEKQPLSDISVIDDHCGPATYVSGDENHNKKLDHAETWVFSAMTLPKFCHHHPVTNIATATGTWNKQTASDTDSYTLYPFILRKDVQLNSEKGPIDYDDPDTIFHIKILKCKETLATLCFSESTPQRIWLGEGHFHLREIDIPQGYCPGEDTISITPGKTCPDITVRNLLTIEEPEEPEEPQEPEEPEEPEVPEEPEDPQEPETPEEPEEPEEPTSLVTSTRHRSFYHNKPPVAVITSLNNVFVNEEITFDGQISYDPDGFLMSYEWSFGDGTTAAVATLTHRYSRAGVYPVVLTIIDNNGAIDTDRTSVTIIQPNRPPSPSLISGLANGTTQTQYSFVFGSTDEDGDTLSYHIDWGDGSSVQSEFLPSGQLIGLLHEWDTPGTYTITVTASDGRLSAVAFKEIVIQEALVVDNIAIIGLALLALIALLGILLFSKKKKND